MCTWICLSISAFLLIVFEQNGHPHTQSAIFMGSFWKKWRKYFPSKQFIYNDKILDRHMANTIIWLKQLLFWANFSIQYGQENGFSPVCEQICLRIISPIHIIFGQNGQAYVCPASLMGAACNKWIRNIWWNFQIIGTFFFHAKNHLLWYFIICVEQLYFWVNDLLQYGHLKGFSPVWVLICLCIKAPVLITIGQNGHAYFCPASLMGSVCNKWIRCIFLGSF